MKSLAGQVAVVTGASRGVGEATARSLAEQGATVVRLARSLADGEDGPYFNLTTDLTDPVLLKRAMDEILAEFGPPHIVVNNAGGFLLRLKTLSARIGLYTRMRVISGRVWGGSQWTGAPFG